MTYIRIDKFGGKHWYLNGKLHREDGPAVEYFNEYKEWWLNGQPYYKEEWEVEKIKRKCK